MNDGFDDPVGSPAYEYIPYRPALQGPFRERFYAVAQILATQASQPFAVVDRLITAEIDWAVAESALNPAQRRIYRAAWLLLRDLLQVGWHYRWHDARFEIAPPREDATPTDPATLAAAKERVRAAMAEERAARIRIATDFIVGVERDQATRPSILALVADGAVLSTTLRRLALIEDSTERTLALQQVVQPYLQLVHEGERCAITGHLLSDIWRYFRFTWTTPVYNTPGRNLFYLIRDAGQPNHPIMGIAALANAPLRILKRDEYFGWTVDAFARRVNTVWQQTSDLAAVRLEFMQLLHNVDQGVAGIDPTGLATEEELAHPTPAVLTRLALEAERSTIERVDALRDWSVYLNRVQELDDLTENQALVEPSKSKYGNISQRAQEALFRKKRALDLIRLLRTRRYLTTLLLVDNFAQDWTTSLTSEKGRAAVSAALLAVKSAHVGSSIMELSICGAIPPYNELLGGKLVAMLMLSPQVVADYRVRYGHAPSQIASQLKAADVVRPAELVYLGTTSLYKVGSSQYNRIQLPTGLLRPDGPAVRYRLLGATSGYGTLHISDATTRALEEASNDAGYVAVNHVFGEGGSPKLRVLRTALDSVLEQFPGSRAATEKIAMHRMTRLVYGMDLAVNTVAYLQGRTNQPDYYFDTAADPHEATAVISAYWVERWLSKRIRQREVLDRMAKFDHEQIRVGQGLEGASGHYKPIEGEAIAVTTTDDVQSRMRALIRSLYRGTGACADATAPDQLLLLHIPTPLDAAILQHVQAGRSVVLTRASVHCRLPADS